MMCDFQMKLSEHYPAGLRKRRIEILQVNLGKLCNLACIHCHVDAGPTKLSENMTFQTAEAVVALMDKLSIETLDLTGGAPELNSNFQYLVENARKRDIHVIDRCNLTVFFEPEMGYLPRFLAANKVEIIASLPCYSQENVDQQRGKGTFDASIQALQWLNRLRYGQEESDLRLNLIYNPVGLALPPPQLDLEKDYKRRLKEDFGIIFNHLYTITTMPINRYARYLKTRAEYAPYISLLRQNFNPETLEDLMCGNTLNVGWDGKIYDCDFNQMLGMQIKNVQPLDVFNVTQNNIKSLEVQTADHCFGCTAGSGSSCQGSLIQTEEGQHAISK